MRKRVIKMKKVTKKAIITFSVLITFLLLFGKMLFIYIMGFLFFGSPNEEFIINEMGAPLIVGESWDEKNFFQITITEITFLEKMICTLFAGQNPVRRVFT